MFQSEQASLSRPADEVPVDAVNDAAITRFALTPTQRGLLADSLAAETRGLNVEQIVCEIDAWLDDAALREAWQGAMDEFDALRIQFEFRSGDVPTQRIASSCILPFRYFDWSTHEAASAEQAIQEFVEHDRWQGFELSGVPLFRVNVFRFPASRTVILWTVHHTIIDGASYPLVFDRVLSGVGCANGARSSTRTAFETFLAWHGNHDPQPGIEYYRNVLRGFSEPTPLPFAGLTRRRQVDEPAANVESRLDGKLTSALQAVAVESQASMNTMVQLAWGLLLGRYTGRDDVVFGVTWSGRPNTIEGAARVVGPFINTLPVRVDVSASPSCRCALQSLRAQHLLSRPFHQTPVAKIKEASELSRAKAMFRTLVVFEQQRPLARLEKVESSDARRKFWTRSQTGFALALAARLEGDALAFELEYDTALFDAAQAREFLDGLTRLLRAMPAALDQSVDGLPTIEPRRYRSMTIEEAEREIAIERPRVIEQILERGILQPDAMAVCDLVGGVISYAKLRLRVLRAASVLRRLGVRQGAVVAIMIPRSIDAIVAQLAAHQAGAAFLMLDMGFPAARLREILEDSGARWLVVTPQTRDVAGDTTARQVGIEELDLPASRKARVSTRSPGTDRDAGQELAYVIYTSGSTGKPKGVRISQASLANHIAACVDLYDLRQTDRVLQFSAQSFDASIEEIFTTLAVGGTLILRNDQMASSPREFFSAVEAHRLSVLDLPTAFWHQIVQLSDDRPWPGCVRLLIVGGERASPTVLRRFRESGNGHIRWLNSYGPTETTIGSTLYDDRSGDHSEDCLPIGRSLPGHAHYVLDHRLRPVPDGVAGQLHIGGAGVALGYHDRAELTAKRFIDHPWRPGAKLYATGDLVRRTPQGNYVYVDRVDNQVKVRGFRVELGEIEMRLRQHPLVREAVVIVHEHGEESSSLVGFVESDGGVGALAVREYLASMLPHYMVPGHIVVEAHLPRTNAGKLDRQALRMRELTHESQGVQPAADLDPLEAALLGIWSELLEAPVHDTLADFFEMGGNSLTVMSLLATIEKRFDKTLNPVVFLRTPTLKHLAEMIKGEAVATNSSLLRLSAGKPGVRPLFFTPGVTGRGSDYVHLVGELDRSIGAYAIQIRGLRNRETPHPNLEEAAQDYANWMQEVQPKGPYALAGFSAGCILVAVIAKVLIERGERVDFAGLIDGIPPPGIEFPSAFTSAHRLRNFARTAVGRIVEVTRASNPVRKLWQRGMLAARRIMAHSFSGSSGKETTIDEIFVGQDVPFAEAEKRVMQAHLSLLMQSKPAPIPVDVVLFRTALNPLTGPYEADLGWSRVVRGQVFIEMMRGRHNDLITEPGAPALGERMNRYLAQRKR